MYIYLLTYSQSFVASILVILGQNYLIPKNIGPVHLCELMLSLYGLVLQRQWRLRC